MEGGGDSGGGGRPPSPPPLPTLISTVTKDSSIPQLCTLITTPVLHLQIMTLNSRRCLAGWGRRGLDCSADAAMSGVFAEGMLLSEEGVFAVMLLSQGSCNQSVLVCR